MTTMLKKISIFVILIFSFLIIIVKLNNIEEKNTTNQNVDIYKSKTFNISSDTNKVIAKAEDTYDFYLNKSNLLNLNINENIDDLDYVEFDSNRLNMIS